MLDHKKPVFRTTLCIVMCLLGILSAWPLCAEENPDWFSVEYGALLEQRAITHCGESVAVVLDRFAKSTAAGTPSSFDLRMLDSLLEPYAFVLPDTVDYLQGAPDKPMVEIGWLWEPGEESPAWVELLRSRKMVAESDGLGGLRFFLPVPDEKLLNGNSEQAARSAWDAAWTILRHVVAAELNRLKQAGKETVTLDVTVFPYHHKRADTSFELGILPFHTQVSDTTPTGDRPLLDLSQWSRFLERGLRLEGGILDNGHVRLIGSEVTSSPTLLGQSLSLADLAVAYRAVFHGGHSDPFMSLDRGHSPHRSNVNYGGRLQDTTLGMVALLCDIRFKTFTLGIDPLTLEDVSEKVRGTVPEFESHMERFPRTPDSQAILSQKTRFWFYPDDVDVVLAPEGDVLVMRKVRMSASSERVDEGVLHTTKKEVPPWTSDLVEEINRDYPGLSEYFDELNSLDETVRLFTFFSWLKMQEARGVLLPDLDVLLAVRLPGIRTPRSFPQMLVFTAASDDDVSRGIDVFQRSDIVSALDRLSPRAGGLRSAGLRFKKALAGLDSKYSNQKALREQMLALSVEQLSAIDLDSWTYRAKRMRMHNLVMMTLPMTQRRDLIDRKQAGEKLRLFTAATGGIDLGMDKALKQASGRSVSMGWGEPKTPLDFPDVLRQVPQSQSTVKVIFKLQSQTPRSLWKKDLEGVPATVLPDHGQDMGLLASTGTDDNHTWQMVIHGEDSPEIRARRTEFDQQGRLVQIARLEGSRQIRYRATREGRTIQMLLMADAPIPTKTPVPAKLVPGLTLLEVTPLASDRIQLKFSGVTVPATEFAVPFRVMETLLLGHSADLGMGRKLPGIDDPIPSLRAAASLMVFHQDLTIGEALRRTVSPLDPVADPVRVGRALAAWWSGHQWVTKHSPVVIGTDYAHSFQRWSTAPTGMNKALWLASDDAIYGLGEKIINVLNDAWGDNRGATSIREHSERLVVLVSAETPGLLAARVRKLAANPAMKGRILAICSLSGEFRPDFAGSLLRESSLAAVGILQTEPLVHAGVAEKLAALSQSLATADKTARVENLGGEFTWFY